MSASTVVLMVGGLLVFFVMGLFGVSIWLYCCFNTKVDSTKQPLLQPFPLLHYIVIIALCVMMLECLGLLWLMLRPESIAGEGQWLWQAFFRISEDSFPYGGWGTFWIALVPILMITLLITVLVRALVKIIRD